MQVAKFLKTNLATQKGLIYLEHRVTRNIFANAKYNHDLEQFLATLGGSPCSDHTKRSVG